MADGVEIDIRGLVETQRALYQFSERLGDRVTLLALRTGSNYMLKKVREAEPVKTGRLKRATVVKNSRINQRRRNGKVGVYITVKPGKKRTDTKGAWYGKFVEIGYKRGSTVIDGRHFVKATFEANKQAALDLTLQAIEEGGQRLLQEINR
ncbi:MAG: HK97-gp10 family putative phage morphogenesis protein [Methylobacter sp.]